MGTISWMPPEAFINMAQKKRRRRTKLSYEFDVWALGLLVLDARLSGYLHRIVRHEPVS